MRISRSLHRFLIPAALLLAWLSIGSPAASAQTSTASASAKRIGALCAKRAHRATRARPGAAHASLAIRRKRQAALRRRCLVRFQRTSTTKPGKRDSVPPSVAWQAPVDGGTVSGRLEWSRCEAAASDNRGVERVVFSVDGTTLNTEREVPYNCVFDTIAIADGSHTLTATAYDAAGNAGSASISVEVSNGPEVAPATEASGSGSEALSPGNAHLAIGIDGGYGSWWSEEVELRTALGAAVTRHEWDPAQPVEAQDGLVLAAASQVHTRIHALLGANSLGDPTHYREWVVAFIRRYGLGGSFWSEHPELDASRYAITSFELGNEPYFGTMSATEYADTVRPTLEEVARLGLPAEIVLPDWTHGTDNSWMDTLYQRIPNLNSLFYAFAEHPYWYGHDPAESGPGGPFARIDQLRRRMNEHGASAKPILITEYGESTASCGSQCVSEAVQAEHLKEMIDAVVSRPEWGVEMLLIFQLHDWATNSTNREKQFGILRQDGTAKPAYPIASAAMQQYRG